MVNEKQKKFKKYLFGIVVILYTVERGGCDQQCDVGGVTEPCQYGCCNQGCCPYSVSTSVLIVAGIVGGLIVIALVVALVICCVKTYRDKRASRVRQLRPGQHSHENHIPQRPVEPRKPPAYIEAPPPYSSEMPESHYRPITVTGHYLSYNQRFRTPVPNHGHNGNNRTRNNNRAVPASDVTQRALETTNHTVTTIHEGPEGSNQEARIPLPGTTSHDPPQTNSISSRRLSPGQRRRRFIQTPDSSNAEHNQTQARNESESSSSCIRENNLEPHNSERSVSISRQVTALSTNNSNNRTGEYRTQDARRTNLTLQSQTASDLALLNTEAQNQPANSSVILPHPTQQIRHSDMETAVSRARSRQMATPATPQHVQAVSRRHAGNTRPISDSRNLEIEELACL